MIIRIGVNTLIDASQILLMASAAQVPENIRKNALDFAERKGSGKTYILLKNGTAIIAGISFERLRTRWAEAIGEQD